MRRHRIGSARLTAAEARTLTLSSGAPLATELRDRLEWAYETPLGDVRVHAGAAADALNHRLGTLAVTWRHHVVLSDELTRCEPAARQLVLAHEVAHVVQKRRHAATSGVRTCESARRCEQEAASAAASALVGRRFAITCDDEPDAIAAWGPAGHYYTTYYVALAAGVSAERAERIAFFCQMPDQITELDAARTVEILIEAVQAGRQELPRIGANIAGTLLGSPVSMVATAVSASKLVPTRSHATWFDGAIHLAASLGDLADRPEFQALLDIQIGLHCLTGGSADVEQPFRWQIGADTAKSKEAGRDWRLGLALHAYGDSYAHCRLDNSSTLYNWGLGHAQEGCDAWHDPDNPARRPDLYLKYGRGMFEILQGYGGRSSGQSRADSDTVEKRLSEVSAFSSVRDQAAKLYGLASDLASPPDMQWMRELDTVSYDTFAKWFSVPPLEQLRALAKEWRFSPRRLTSVAGPTMSPARAAMAWGT